MEYEELKRKYYEFVDILMKCFTERDFVYECLELFCYLPYQKKQILINLFS